jgi:hypothetical protein
VDVREKQKRLSLMVITDGSIRFQDLYGLLHNPDWLYTAYKHVKRNAGSKTAGCDGMNMGDFEEKLEENSRNSEKPSRQKCLNPFRYGDELSGKRRRMDASRNVLWVSRCFVHTAPPYSDAWEFL